MKNFSKSIAAISLSLMTVGAMAQSMTNTFEVIPNSPQRAIVTHNPILNKLSNHKVANAVTNYAFLDYPYMDSIYASNQGVSYSASPLAFQGYYIQPINGRYTAADTGNPNTNNLLLVNYAVSFDTLIDANSQSPDYTTQGVEVDSLFIPVGQQNVSGTKDTLVVSINAVGAYGIPNNTVLWDTVLVQDTGFSGVGKSWFFSTTLVFAPHITVPGTGKFGVVVSYFGNKRDSMGFLYAYPEFSCSTPAGNMPDTSYVGQMIPVGKPVKNLMANSYTTGYTYFEAGHVGSPITLPNTTYGDFIGYTCSTPKTFSAGPFQDIVMFAEISYTSTLGMSTLSQTGLSVAQNYPNPFNKATTINYSLSKPSNVTFTVYDMTGRIITSTNYGNLATGQYQVNLNANTFSPGVYFYTFNVNGSTVTNKMVITE